MKLFQKLTALFCVAGLICSTYTVPVHAQDLSVVLPSGLTIAEFSQKMEEANEPTKFASASIGVFQGNEILYTGYFGETNLKEDIPTDENSVYEWGSISKTFVWVSVMQLWEQGKLELDEDIRNYLPENFFQHLTYDEPITMLNLMNHNAGWCENTYTIATKDASTIRTLKETLQESEPAQVHRPGEVTSYSNWGAALAGYIVECVSGMDYCDYVHENILTPLGMEHTSINPTHSDNIWVQKQREKMHSYLFNPLSLADLGPCIDYIECYPAGAATGTLTDLMTYAQAFVNEDAPLFENPETQRILLSGSSFYGTSDIPSCCHGFLPTEYSIRTYGHSGATKACLANMLFDPESGIGMVVLVNEPQGNWYINNTPTFTFGSLNETKYATNPEVFKPEGYYLLSRSTYRGLLKFIPYLSASKLIGEFQYIGEDVYQITADGSAMLMGETQYGDGSKGFSVTSMDLIQDHMYVGTLCLFTIYAVLGIISTYLLRIKWKLWRAKRWIPYAGSVVITTGHIAKVVSIFALIMSMFFYNRSYGMSIEAGTAIGIIQMVCIATCIIATVTSCIFMLSKKESKKTMIRYALSTTGNILAIFAMVYFEMYRFWGC